MQGGLSGRVYVSTRYRDLGNGSVESLEKHDVTEDFEALRYADLVEARERAEKAEARIQAVHDYEMCPSERGDCCCRTIWRLLGLDGAVPPAAAPAEALHKPFTDDGVTYCGWDGHEGCGEMWPCSTTRRARALFLAAALADAAAEDAG